MRCTDLMCRSHISLGLVALLAVACTDSPTSVIAPVSDNPLFAVVGKPPINQTLEGEVWVCKDGTGPATSFAFSVSIDGGAATTHNVALGTCLRIADYAIPAPPGQFFHTFSITEQVPANWTLNAAILIESNAGNPSVTYQPVVNAPNARARVSHDWGLVFTFTNTHTPPPPPQVGCTRTPGYWKNHAGNGKKQDVVTALLPIWLGTAGGASSVQVTTSAQAIFILDKENDPASDGLNKLRAHLLAAKLNIAKGATGTAVASTIAAADAFLATHGDWNALTAAEQAQVLAWKDALDDYNNGLTGPGHCDG